MRIKLIELTEVVVPANAGAISSIGIDQPLHMLPYGGRPGWTMQFDELPKWIIEVHSDDGEVGWGETVRGAYLGDVRHMAESLLGAEIDSLCWAALPLPRTQEYDGFECAIYDLAGKLSGLPLYQLLGGAARTRVPVSAWSSHRTPQDAAEVAVTARDSGFRCIKFKCALEDDVVGWCDEIKDRCGDDFHVILDPNGRFDELRHALRIARGLERIGNVLCIEDPLPRWDLESYAELRRRTDVPIAVHVALEYRLQGQRSEDVLRALRADAADVFNLAAGIAEFGRLAAIAWMAGRPFWHGSQVDLGILEAAFTHVAAASEGCTLPSDIFGRAIREHDLLREPLRIVNGFVEIPSGPGLGIDVDREALAAYGRKTVTVR